VNIGVGYMGTKRYLANTVAEVIGSCKKGIVLDAFAGMCSVGEAVNMSRTVWNNDVQVFASEVARALFTSASMPLSAADATSKLFDSFCENRDALQKRFLFRLEEEENALKSGEFHEYMAYHATGSYVGNDILLNEERASLTGNSTQFPYRMASITFADGYFGLAQAIEIDSIRFSIDRAMEFRLIDIDEHRWLIIALCVACVKVATTTGHFAQYLSPSPSNFKRFLQQRKKSVWTTWLDCLVNLLPLGSTGWRKKNRVFKSDCLALFSHLATVSQKPSVIYADPPYTADHYSRYYHVWESLFLYDYPECSGVGRYRPDRFSTPFSIKTKVSAAMESFVKGSRALNADLVLSYPNNGLLQTTNSDLFLILKNSYRRVQVVHCIDYKHSTMGASNGVSKNEVKELIYLARP
jgi:adenine-specific DNA-methyltransferase